MPKDIKQYATSASFRKAIEDRLKNIFNKKNIPLDRLRRKVSFDRFLSRLFSPEVKDPIWLLKGGYALEFRYHNIARTTKDIDLTIPKMSKSDPDKIRELLQDKAQKDTGDWFEFLIGNPMSELESVYGGWRFPVVARLDKRVFTKFHIDVGIGDAVISKTEWKEGEDLLGFAGIKPAYVAILPKDQHFAEKIHAYSFPREKRQFSRIRDLVDLVLLIEQGLPDNEVIKKAIKATFQRRKTHDLPKELLPPPDNARQSYNEMAEECGVTKKDMLDAFYFVQEFLKEII